MANESPPKSPDPFLDALGDLGSAALTALHALEAIQRRLHPPDLPALRQSIEPVRDRLAVALDGFPAAPPPPGLEPLANALAEAASPALEALRGFTQDDGDIGRMMLAMHQHCRAQEALFALRRAFPPVNQFFFEEPCRDRIGELDPEPIEGARVGLQNAHDDPGQRGGFSFYVPESYDDNEPWPLVVALHGGSGQGRDFLWSWLREARSRQFLLMAPTARGAAWSFNGPDVDAPALRSMVEFVAERWKIDAQRVLLTGLSDGATYTLVCGLQPDMPFTALAPVSGVLHPAATLAGAAGKRIYLVHGALDWMFPVGLARAAAEQLRGAGADLTYREIEDLSHTYPREENARILEWFDAGMGLE